MNDANPQVYVCEEVRQVRRLHGDLFTDAFRRLPVQDQLERQAQRILAGHQSGNEAVWTQIKCWHPQLVGHSRDEIMARELSLDDARETIAREYGFKNWPDAKLRGANPPDGEYEAAVDLLLAGDAFALRQRLESRPALVYGRSHFGHRATLLHYVGSNGVETYRQVVPRNLAEITRILLDAGADVNAAAEMYGGGSTTIALLISSGHPAEAGVMDEVVAILLAAGAKTN